jgi:signal transduction histidine kinase
LRKKDFFFFFILPFTGVLFLFLILSAVNRSFIKAKVEDVVEEQLSASARILKVHITRLLEEEYPPDKVLRSYEDEENIYFMALLNGQKEILDWVSRFEGYLPFSERSAAGRDTQIIESPVGNIFTVFTSFSTRAGARYHLYLGYSLESLEDMLAYSRRNFLYLLAAMAVVGMIFFRGIFEIHRHYLAKAEEAVAEKKEKERFKEISGFTAAVAHEIKNPLNSLGLLCQLLQSKAPAGLSEDIKLGQGEVQKISRIIDQFSEMITPLSLRKDLCRIGDMLVDIQAMLAAESRARGVPIEYFQTRPLVLPADKMLLTQAVYNVVKNSLEATTRGAVVIRAESHRKKILIVISDSGTGITEEDLPRIFEPFFSTKSTGMGIGLYVAKKIIEAHDGTIEVNSGQDRGTTFLIELPGGVS